MERKSKSRVLTQRITLLLTVLLIFLTLRFCVLAHDNPKQALTHLTIVQLVSAIVNNTEVDPEQLQLALQDLAQLHVNNYDGSAISGKRLGHWDITVQSGMDPVSFELVHYVDGLTYNFQDDITPIDGIATINDMHSVNAFFQKHRLLFEVKAE